MVRYFYAWTPFVIVGTIVVLSAPWLALIALMLVPLVALAALAALAWAVVFVPYHMLSRAIGRRWHRSDVGSPTAAALSPAGRQDGQPLFGKEALS